MEITVNVENLCKLYSNIKAAENINFSICRGEILGLNPQKDRKKLFEKVGVQFQEANY